MSLPSEIDSGDGRRFSLREADPATMLDLIEAAGSAASSGAWMRYALMVCSVSAIDGTPVMMPTTKQKIRELGTRIGNRGMEAIAAVTYPPLPVEADDETAQAGDQTAKN